MNGTNPKAITRFPQYEMVMTPCFIWEVATLLSTTCTERTIDEINPYNNARSGSLEIADEARENEGATPTKKPQVTTKAERKTYSLGIVRVKSEEMRMVKGRIRPLAI
jgi:hypothetical protein